MAVASEGIGVKGKTFAGHPIGLSTLFFTEMWERFSYYGIRPLLVLFMSAALADGGFGFEREQASAIVGIYAACVYLASLPGGWIADKLLGLQKAILYGAICISAGHISIGISAFLGGKATFFLGLVLIVLGTGLLKPNISAIVGDLYPEGGSRRDAGFSIFYMGINIGALLGQTVTGFLGEKIGWHWGFSAAGVAMLLGLFVFTTRRKSTLGSIGAEPSKHPDPRIQAKIERRIKISIAVFVAVLALVFILAATGVITINAKLVAQSMTYVLVGVAVIYFLYLFTLGGLNSDEKKRVLVIGVLFVAAAVFWSAFEQAPTSLNLFAKDFTQREVFGFEVPATWFQSVNPLLIILLAPVFAYIWTWLGQRGMDLSSPAKFALGLFFAAIGFLVMIFASMEVVASDGQIKVSMFWLVASYFFQTVGELCLSPVGLSSMTKLSPRRFVGQMMGVWFLAAAVGNLIGGLVGGHVDPEKLEQMPVLFTYTTASLAIATLILVALIIPIRRMMKNVEV
ncbi:MAG: MFS transporter [Acidobacteria bacterium]|jgi:POT family proton-dependent oligopeptide transporter|nr:MAG: MFS transporter [Acidobacteriota bacterium]GIU83147.1 MAG: MFS transporter [Pyrinomonadaceae bacterium]